MKIFSRGKMISPIGSTKTLKCKTAKEITGPRRRLIAQYKFNNTLYDLIPEFNEGFKYTYEDVVEEGETTRTIYSIDLPTMIKFGGDVTAYKLNPNKFNSLLVVLYVNTTNIDDMSYMFAYCGSLTLLDSSDWDTSNVTNMTQMFYECKQLTSLDVSKWDTSKVTDMSYMFYKCGKLVNLDLSNFDISEVTFMSSMFNECTNLTSLNLNNWNINNSSVSMYNLFTNANNLNNILMNNSDYNSVNKIIAQLPTRTTDSIGTLDIDRIDNIGQVDIDTLNNKYWIIASHTILNHARLDQTKIGN